MGYRHLSCERKGVFFNQLRPQTRGLRPRLFPRCLRSKELHVPVYEAAVAPSSRKMGYRHLCRERKGVLFNQLRPQIRGTPPSTQVERISICDISGRTSCTFLCTRRPLPFDAAVPTSAPEGRATSESLRSQGGPLRSTIAAVAFNYRVQLSRSTIAAFCSS